ncbi:MAG: hypothetical protein HYU64_16795 [Armatimonadetes bacterium]|nr:hypothetical protein [Armatimonadota bacterium]
METLETRLGLTPEEMITMFNRMYLDVWEKTRDKINWRETDVPKLLLEVLEVVVTAVRDGAMLAMFENNERIYSELKEAGVTFSAGKTSESEAATGES